MTGEDWDDIMYDGVAAMGGISSNGFVACIYAVLVVVLGNFLLLNVFLAIAVKSLDDAKGLKEAREAHLEKWDTSPALQQEDPVDNPMHTYTDPRLNKPTEREQHASL